MAIFSGGKSTAVDSPRHLAIRHARKLAAAAREGQVDRCLLTTSGDSDNSEPLKPGEERLNSYWAPGLTAGPRHRVSVSQTIRVPDQELKLAAEQEFSVDAPQLSLPADAIHSVYPPPGYSEDHRILPHVVLTDPHLPWERLGSAQSAGTQTKTGKPPRNRVPWLAVLSFSQDELRLPREHLDGPRSLFRNTGPGVVKPVKQSSTMTVDMSAADLWRVAPLDSPDVTTPVTRDPDRAEQRGRFIFIKRDLFTSLFSAFDAHGRPQPQAHADPRPYQFLAHVRTINPEGMALAGVEDTAIFSLVVGNRAGPLDQALPTTVTAHLVSLEGVEAVGLPVKTPYVALCSLHSWNYTVLPPGSLNVGDALTHLGRTLDVLRAPESVVAPLRASGDAIKQRVARRLNDGYTLMRHQTQTGEPTMALFRGPLTPTYVGPLASLNRCSNSGVDLQILDRDLGIMDVSYSVAWQVGRTMALGDESFSAALCRVRTAISSGALAAAKTRTLKDVAAHSIRTRPDVLSNLSDVVASLSAIHLPSAAFTAPSVPTQRWHRPRLTSTEIPNLSLAAPAIQDKYPREALETARLLAQSTTGDIHETNVLSSDWTTVLQWLLDRMFLAGVPAHCLIPDPSALGRETLRFFHIDANWVDALLDGALSLGNHQGTDHDRVAIKKALNEYIRAEDPKTGHKTQIPAYGFLLRSDLVTRFPDLRVQILPEGDGAPLLRHEIMADGVMLALTDRAPTSPAFRSLVLTQPPHQQRFAAARSLDTTKIDVDIRRQYTVDQQTRETDRHRHEPLRTLTFGPKEEDGLFIWSSTPDSLSDLRILRLPRYADLQLKVLREEMPKHNGQIPYFEDDEASSALLALQLNDPVYQLTVSLAPTGPLAALPGEHVRTLTQLQPSLVHKHTPSDPVELAAAPQSGQLHGDLNWERLQTAPRPAAHLAPHIRAVPSLSISPTTLLSSSPASYPRFTILITSNVLPRRPTISLSTPNLPQDLIISITVTQDPSNEYTLREVYIDIPLGPAPLCLLSSYTGPGIAMLTNLRFNALLVKVTTGGMSFLRVRILPRAATGWIPMRGIKEMSALLALAKVNPAVGQLTVRSWARYGDDQVVALEPTVVTVETPGAP